MAIWAADGLPLLAWETAEGDLDPTKPADVATKLGEGKAPLVFLSACRTAEAGGQATVGISEPFVRALIRSGVTNELGWAGSVFDSDAIDFAQRFYREVAMTDVNYVGGAPPDSAAPHSAAHSQRCRSWPPAP